ncbi:putative NTP binding protein [Thermoascus aurantiacus ATCC 26904]
MSSTAPLDPKVSTADPDDLDEDALFEALEKEDDSTYRAHRIEQLHAEFASAKDSLRTAAGSSSTTTIVNNALYPTLPNDQSLLDFTTQSQRCVVHFSHPDFARCGIMDEHLQLLASRHYEVRFARVDVRDCPFVVERLNVRVLPCVIGFVDGVGVERVVGFEGLGSGGQRDGINGFRTVELERRLLKKGILVRKKLRQGEDSSGAWDGESDSEEDAEVRRKGERRGICNANARQSKDDEDDDWD